MEIFDVAHLVAKQPSAEHSYSEFYRGELLSLGFAIWPAEAADTQKPHAEDEVYYVVAGRGRIQVADDDKAVGPGSIVYVPARVPHRFHTIEETLQVIVFWAPPHHSREQPSETVNVK